VTTRLDKVPIRDILLDFDRTHNLVINVAYNTDEDWGPEMMGGHPLGNVVVSVSSFIRSGRPYTSSLNTKLINGARTPTEYNTNMRLSKRIRDFFGTNATFYVEVFNLFDNKILNYSYIFSTPDAGSTNNRIAAYEHYAIDDPAHGILYWQDTNSGGPFAVDQSFLIYSKSPRSFNFGFSLDL
jgi:hypothetical protein